MRPPLAGKRAAARRLAEQLRRRLPGVESGGEPVTTPARPAHTPEDAAARIDAARERLRAQIEAPADPDA